MTSTAPQLVPGSLFARRYRVGRLLGRGAMGTIVAAGDVSTGAQVALKCLLPIHCDDPRAVARFRREARVTARLSSEHVVRVLAVGEEPGDAVSPPVPYFVMERLEGRDLRTVVVDDGPLTPRQAVKCVAHACAALAEVHALGIVHRDVKPSNLFLTRRGDGRTILKVLDFGVAHFDTPNASGDSAVLTAEAELVGSAGYMAPEQILDARSVDARADIWSLGVLLHFLVTGEKPFQGESRTDVLLDILRGKPRPLLEVRPDLPEAFAEIVRRCLDKDRERRYASVVDLSRALAPFLGPRPADARSSAVPGDVPATPPT